MDSLSVFVDIVNDYIIKENISLNQFSKRINIAGSAVSKWMTKEYFPTIDCAIKVSDCLNNSLDYLFGLTDNPTLYQKDNTIEFITRFKQILERKKITAYRVAKDCNIGESAISKWKRGIYPKTETLITLAKYFSCSIDYLVGREG